jgi:hypothetical protein
MVEHALGCMALRTPVIVGYSCLDPVGYQGPGEDHKVSSQTLVVIRQIEEAAWTRDR